VRQEQLKTMMDNSVAKALSQGYTAEEIEEAFNAQLARWLRMKK
jgi:hypothetical protein